jgi:benzoate membrane transport protein
VTDKEAGVPGAPARGSILQPIASGVLAAVVGFAGAVAIVLAGFTAVGASAQEAASGLFAISLVMGVIGIGLSLWSRMPVTVAWSTPGSALLIATVTPDGGYPEAVGAYVVAALLIIAAGLWRPFGRAVAAIPMPLASAMLAGILLGICLAPLRAVAGLPSLALPIVIAWALSLRFARAYAVPIAVVVAAVLIVAATEIPPAAFSALGPAPILITPVFTLHTAIGIGVPLFIVTMASQNVPGLAVLTANGYRPDVRSIFVTTGLGSLLTAFLGGHSLNLAAITAALCAGPEAHPDPARRWIASVACGAAYVALAFAAGFATAFVTASPPLLIETVAGLALLGTLARALVSSLSLERDRLPAIVAFVATASGVTFFGIGAAFWGLLAGGAVMAILNWQGLRDGA